MSVPTQANYTPYILIWEGEGGEFLLSRVSSFPFHPYFPFIRPFTFIFFPFALPFPVFFWVPLGVTEAIMLVRGHHTVDDAVEVDDTDHAAMFLTPLVVAFGTQFGCCPVASWVVPPDLLLGVLLA